MNPQTPLLKQYYEAKKPHPETLLAMRVGDFYEFYGEDAEIAAKALEITLTGKEDGANGRIPMAGVPYHAIEKYLSKLLSQGFKVALCDQLEDPKLTKKLVKREVTRVLTPGTVLEDSMLESSQNNFLAGLCVIDGKAGLAILDPSTGDFSVTEIGGHEVYHKLLQELARISPAEILLSSEASELKEQVSKTLKLAITSSKPPVLKKAMESLKEQFHVQNLEGYGCEDKPNAIIAASMVLEYIKANGLPTSHIDSMRSYALEEYMTLDISTRRSLELTRNLADGGKNHTLFQTVNACVTSMGARTLRRWIEQPLLRMDIIQDRLDSVEQFFEQTFSREALREILKQIHDIERLVSRCATGLATPRDLSSLKNSLNLIPQVKVPLQEVESPLLRQLKTALGDHTELAKLLCKAVHSNPPATLKEGGVICEGFDPELDQLRSLSKTGKKYIANLEQEERKKTGISNLKVGYNSVFGYYLEVSKIHTSKIPEQYIRKQTTANAERYITAELKEHESTITGAEQKAIALEAELFQKIRKQVTLHASLLFKSAKSLAQLDVLSAFAEVASSRGYTKPKLVDQDILDLKEARHPVVESTLPTFVPNDVALTSSTLEDFPERMVILTGPNMSGKSTYLRQTALIVLLAQTGSFVPATACQMGLCDRIFARIGAKDEIALGQSTFMIEMLETANILNHATSRSLIILDEVGRGTSTYDGLAIAWAMSEHLAKIGSKTMFATHYHQLNALADQIRGVVNYRVSVEEIEDRVVWTHRVLKGGTDRSYGIHVARMAGVPHSVLKRSHQILEELEGKEQVLNPSQSFSESSSHIQGALFEAETPQILKELRDLSVDSITPMKALELLDQWKSKFC